MELLQKSKDGEFDIAESDLTVLKYLLQDKRLTNKTITDVMAAFLFAGVEQVNSLSLCLSLMILRSDMDMHVNFFVHCTYYFSSLYSGISYFSEILQWLYFIICIILMHCVRPITLSIHVNLTRNSQKFWNISSTFFNLSFSFHDNLIAFRLYIKYREFCKF